MKRKFLIILLITLLLALTAITVTACNKGNYTVTFVADGKVVQAFECDKKTTSIEEPAVPDKYGYTGAWESYRLTGNDLTVNAVYTPKQYNIVFNYEGADGTYQTYTTVTFDQAVGTLPEPTKTDCYFAGWYWGDNRISEQTIWNTDTDAQVTFVAKWLPSSEAITYTYNKTAMTATVKSIYNGMTEVFVPNSYNGYRVTAIGDGAFANRKSLTSVYIPASVVSVGSGLFAGSNYVSNITIAPDNESYYSQGGCIITKSRNIVMAATNRAVIPADVTGIGSGAFSGVEISAISLPAGLETIGYEAFKDCTSLALITIPSNVKSLGFRAFFGCKNLVSVNFEAGSAITTIQTRTFYGCSELTQITVPNSVTTISDEAFYGCNKLAQVTIPDSVVTIGETAFSGTAIETLTFGANSNLKTIGRSAFSSCSALASVTLPDKLETIGTSAFDYCTKLTSIVIPASVKTMSQAFYYSGLQEIYYKGTMANWCAFDFSTYYASPMRYASKIYLLNASGEWEQASEIVIPNSVKEIGKYQFVGFGELESVTLPTSVTKIDANAFAECTVKNVYYYGDYESWCNVENASTVFANANLYFPGADGWVKQKVLTVENLTGTITSGEYSNNTEVTVVIIPDVVTYISDNAFSGCTLLASVVMSNRVTHISNGAFSGCSSLTSITLPSTLIFLGENVFDGCTSLKSVVIDEGLQSILSKAFNGCTSLKEVTLPSTLQSINYTAFGGCSNFAVKFNGTLAQWCGINMGSNFSETTGKGLYIWDGDMDDWSLVTELVIPQDVTTVGSNQFSGFSCITSVTLHSGVTSIGSMAFHSCAGLESVSLSSGVTSLGISAFQNCTALKSVTFADDIRLTIIQSGCFNGCTSLKTITIPDSVLNIGAIAFGGCSSLESVNFGQDSELVSLGAGVFNECVSLKGIEIPAKVQSITEIFQNCYSLEFLRVASGNQYYHSYGNCIIQTATNTLIIGCKNSVLPTDGSVTSIGRKAFYMCTGLTGITIPQGVTTIGESAFGYSGLKYILLSNTVQVIGSNCFVGCDELTTITFEKGSQLAQVGQYAFGGCNSLDKVYYGGTLADWCNIDFNDVNSNPMSYANHFYMLDGDDNWQLVTEIVLGDDVTQINNYAFYGFTELTSVTISQSVTSLGSEIFNGCTKLTSVNYTGTTDQWEQLQKSSDWYFGSAITQAVCSNGTVR